jgi:predicted nuclease of predicted toxin-antitoxin system
VKLLFDENLSPKLAELMRDEYPGSIHVRGVGLRGAADSVVWEHARDHGFVIVSKDDDFRQRSFLEGGPPKVVWLQVGNAGTSAVAELLREQAARLRAFHEEDESSLLILRRAV